MANETALITGEFVRTFDDRYRLSLPPELLEALFPDKTNRSVIAKERSGCLSIWHAVVWKEKVEAGIELIRQKIAAHRLEGSLGRVQQFGRLLSTRFGELRIGDRGRVVLPEGFRDFLGVEPGGDVIVIGAAICVELWRPDAWRNYLQTRMPKFNPLFEELSK